MKFPIDLSVLSSGAKFYRADLHIHSYNASYDVTDIKMTPDEIISKAKAEQLDLIALTDHNEISNVPEALESAAKHSLTFIPGVELSTPEGHLLCYFENFASLDNFFGKIDIADRGTTSSRCRTSMLECLNIVKKYTGFALLAHLDDAGGLEDKIPGFPMHKADIICHEALVGFELKHSTSEIFYSDLDINNERKNIGKKRRQNLGFGEQYALARVQFSDSHTLDMLGKNAAGNKRLTRIKMELPSFEGLRIALLEADSRVSVSFPVK